MNTWEDFDREARIVEKDTLKQAPECVQLLQDAVGLVADAFAVQGGSNTNDATVAKMSLLSQNFATLKCTVDLALRGYYIQSMNLLRSIDENWIAFHYLSKYPDKAHLWLRPCKNKKPPAHSAMLNGLDKNFNPFKGGMREWYSTLCRFAHTDPVCVLPQISTDFAPNETTIHFGSTYKDGLFRCSAFAISIWSGLVLSDISQLIPNTSNWHKKNIKVMERIIEFVGQENKKNSLKKPNCLKFSARDGAKTSPRLTSIVRVKGLFYGKKKT